MVEKPLYMLVIVNALLSARNTHYAKSSLLSPLPLCPNIFICFQNNFEGLKHETSSGCNACEVCDGRVIKYSPTPIALCTTFKVTFELWPSR